MQELSKVEKKYGEIAIRPTANILPSVARAEALRVGQPNFKTFGDIYISEGSQKLTNEWKQLTDLVYACAFSIGVKDPPSKGALLIHAQFIQSQFSDMNMLEVKEAFDKYAAFSDLDFKDHHYHIFDNTLIGKILQSYKRYRNQKHIELSKSKSTMLDYTPSKEEIQNEELYYYHFNLFPKYDHLLETEKYIWQEVIAQGLFLNLEKLGLIQMTVKEKKDFAADIEKQLRKSPKKNIKKGVLKTKKVGKEIEILLDKNQFAWECRVQFFKRWIEEQAFGEVDVKKLVLDKLKEKHEKNG